MIEVARYAFTACWLMEDEKVVPVQDMFPNCRKYDKCCSKDKPFWDELNEKLKEISYLKQPFRTKAVLTAIENKAPEGFEGW